MALTNLIREAFSSQATYTSASPGNLQSVTGTFKRLGAGPKVSGDTTAGGLGWSVDVLTSVGTYFKLSTGTAFPASTSSTPQGPFAVDFWIDPFVYNYDGTNTKSLVYMAATSGYYLSIVLAKNGYALTTSTNFAANGTTGTTSAYTMPQNAWTQMRVAWQQLSGYWQFNLSVLVRSIGGAWTEIANFPNYSGYGTISYLAAGIGPNGGGGTINGRLGMVNVYQLGAWADRTLVDSTISDPPVGPIAGYIDPVSGIDTNDGVTAASAIQTVTEFNNRSANAGYFPASAPAQIAPSSLMMASGSGFVTTSAPHGLTVGKTFALAGVSPVWMNSGGTVTSVTSTTFYFTPFYAPTPYAGSGGFSITANSVGRVAPFANGDVANLLNPLDIGSSQLLGATRGLTFKWSGSASGDNIIAWKNVSGASAGGSTTWTQYSSGTYPNIWMTTDGGATDLTGVVIWEDEKVLNHPTGANIAAVAATMNTNSGGKGQCFADTSGTPTLYYVASDNSNPNTSAHVLKRSRNRASGSGSSAVYFTALDMQIIGLQVSKTCLARSADNDPYIGYGIQGDGNFGGTARLSNLLVTYGSKHCIGLTQNVTANEVVLIDGCDAEQASAYTGSGGQEPFVSFTATASGTNGVGPVHNYVSCTSLRPGGLVGSSAGDISQTWNTFLTHNTGGTGQFQAINWINANSPYGVIASYPAAQTLNVVNSICAGVNSGATVSHSVDRCKSTFYPFLTSGTTAPLIVTNSIYAPTLTTSSAPAPCQASGTVIWQGGVYDISQCAMTGYGTSTAPIIRNGVLSITFQNMVFITNGTTTGNTFIYGLTPADTVTMDHNAYQGVSGAPIAGALNDGTTTANRTLAQLQALGKEQASSATFSSLGLNSSYVPQKGSPVINFGASLPSIAGKSDYVGTVRPSRAGPDAGAIQHQYAIPLIIGPDGDVSELPAALELLAQNDVEVTDATKGVILRSPNGTRWRMQVSNMGTPSFTSL